MSEEDDLLMDWPRGDLADEVKRLRRQVATWRDAAGSLRRTAEAGLTEIERLMLENELLREELEDWKRTVRALEPGTHEVVALDWWVTRFEVIDHRATGKGRVLVAFNVTVSSDLQDAGRTLKVFLTDRVDGS